MRMWCKTFCMGNLWSSDNGSSESPALAPQEAERRWGRVKDNMDALECNVRGIVNVEETFTVQIDRRGSLRTAKRVDICPTWSVVSGEQVILHSVSVVRASCMGRRPDGHAATDGPPPTARLFVDGSNCRMLQGAIDKNRTHTEGLTTGFKKILGTLLWSPGKIGDLTIACEEEVEMKKGEGVLAQRPGPHTAVLSELIASESIWRNANAVKVLHKDVEKLEVTDPVMYFTLSYGSTVYGNQHLTPDETGEFISVKKGVLSHMRNFVCTYIEGSRSFMEKDGIVLHVEWSDDAPDDAILVAVLRLSYMRIERGACLEFGPKAQKTVHAPPPQRHPSTPPPAPASPAMTQAPAAAPKQPRPTPPCIPVAPPSLKMEEPSASSMRSHPPPPTSATTRPPHDKDAKD